MEIWPQIFSEKKIRLVENTSDVCLCRQHVAAYGVPKDWGLHTQKLINCGGHLMSSLEPLADPIFYFFFIYFFFIFLVLVHVMNIKFTKSTYSSRKNPFSKVTLNVWYRGNQQR